MHSYVVMPNHVHVLLTPLAALERITFLIKSRMARQANLVLRRTDKHFWQDESLDHWIRSSTEFGRVQTYIERNPVKAGLAARAEDWQWSSASSTHVSLPSASGTPLVCAPRRGKLEVEGCSAVYAFSPLLRGADHESLQLHQFSFA